MLCYILSTKTSSPKILPFSFYNKNTPIFFIITNRNNQKHQTLAVAVRETHKTKKQTFFLTTVSPVFFVLTCSQLIFFGLKKLNFCDNSQSVLPLRRLSKIKYYHKCSPSSSLLY